MVQVIKEYIDKLQGENIFLLHDLTNEFEGEVILKEAIHFDDISCIVDDETINITLDNTYNYTIEIDEIADAEVIFDELIILLENLIKITITI